MITNEQHEQDKQDLHDLLQHIDGLFEAIRVAHHAHSKELIVINDMCRSMHQAIVQLHCRLTRWENGGADEPPI